MKQREKTLTEEDKDKILIIPCSGIGKPGGTIARLAMYYVVEDLCPEETATLCLPLLVIGDEETKKRVQRSPTITIDGCPSKCASKNVQLSGGILSASLNVLRIYRDHLDLEVKSVANPGPRGEKFARIVAGKILEEIEKLKRERDAKIKTSGNSSM